MILNRVLSKPYIGHTLLIIVRRDHSYCMKVDGKFNGRCPVSRSTIYDNRIPVIFNEGLTSNVIPFWEVNRQNICRNRVDDELCHMFGHKIAKVRVHQERPCLLFEVSTLRSGSKLRRDFDKPKGQRRYRPYRLSSPPAPHIRSTLFNDSRVRLNHPIRLCNSSAIPADEGTLPWLQCRPIARSGSEF